MNPVPQAVKPILDIYANEDSFTKRPIETMAMERLEPQYRYRADTPMAARGASQAMMGALSPVQIDHLVRGYFGWLGSFALGGTDMGIHMLMDEPTRPALDPFKFASGGMVAELFPAELKKGVTKKVEAVWDQYKAGKITREEARLKVYELAGGLRGMSWEGTPVGMHPSAGGVSFDNTLDADPTKRKARKLAPVHTKDKVSIGLSAYTPSIKAFASLRARAQKGDRMAAVALQDVAMGGLKQLMQGLHVKITPRRATGLYGGKAEPSLALDVTFRDEERGQVLAALNKFAETFNQEQVHVRHAAKGKTGHVYPDGSYNTPVYTWALNKPLTVKQVQAIIESSNLYGLTFGDDFVEAYYVGDTNDIEALERFRAGANEAGRLLALADGGDGAKAKQGIGRLWAYGRGDGGIGWPGVHGDVSAEPGIRAEAVQRAKSYLAGQSDAASPERSGGRIEAEGSGSQPGHGDRPVYGRATPGSVQAVGVHYSPKALDRLSGAYYGRGIPGEERNRVIAAADERLRFRIYFYVNAGKGVFPELGVGNKPHTVQLNNLYDLNADPKGLGRAGGPNAVESAIINAGFDGYVANFGEQRAAVLIGHHTVPVRQEKIGYRGEDTTAVAQAQAPLRQRVYDAIRTPWQSRTAPEWALYVKEKAPDLYKEVGGSGAFSGVGRMWPDQIAAQITADRASPPRFDNLPPREPGETDKLYAKRVIDKIDDVGTLEDKPDLYFNTEKADAIVPLSSLVSSKTEEENKKGGANAPARMAAAARGILSKRDPITVRQTALGQYVITDGNGTYTASKALGFKALPVIIERQQADNLDDIYTEATKYQGDFEDAIWKIARTLGVDALVPPDLKGRERAERKIDSDYDGDATQIKDILRASLVNESLAQAEAAIEALKHVFPVHSAKNSFGKDTADGYRDAKVVIWAGNVKAEIQVHLAEVIAAKERMHDLYVQREGLTRDIKDRGEDWTPATLAEFNRLNAEMKKEYQPAFERSTKSKKAALSTGEPLRIALSSLKGLWSGSNAEQKAPPSGLGTSATGMSSTSKNWVPGGNSIDASVDSASPFYNQPGGDVPKFSPRRKPAPEKTVVAYKLFRVEEDRPGELFPLFVPVWGEDGPKAYKRLSDLISEPWRSRKAGDWAALVKEKAPDLFKEIGGSAAFKGEGYLWPDQIVAAVRAAGNVDQASPQRGFVSPLSKAVEGARQDVMPGAQWKLWIASNKAKLGLKDDEIQWSGINEYLDLRGKDKVSKAEIVGYLSGNGVRVEDVVKGGSNMVTERDLDDAEVEARRTGNWDAYEELVRRQEDEQLGNDANGSGNQTEFASYWGDSYKGGIPGTYREILVTLPSRTQVEVPKRVEYQRFENGQIVAIGTATAARRWRERDPAADIREVEVVDEQAARKLPGFRSFHWSESNVLVHVRLDEVTGADGKRYVRVGEVQSDWGQKGKKKGFYRPEVEPTDEEVRDFFDLRPGANPADYRQEMIDWGWKRGTPAAPFVTDTKAWVALGIKRAILHALDVGADGIVFGTGEQNANLYDLSKQISRVEAKDYAGGLTLSIYDKGDNYVTAKHFNSYNDPGIADFVGKDLAEKIAFDKGSGTLASSTFKRDYRGLDLKVGGEGMRAFYDKIVPQVADTVLKKLGGGKVGTVDLPVPDREVYFGGKTYREPQPMVKQPGFLIPDAMRAKVDAEGMPLFSPQRVIDSGGGYLPGDYITPLLPEFSEGQADLGRVLGMPIRLRQGEIRPADERNLHTGGKEYKRGYGLAHIYDARGRTVIPDYAAGDSAENITRFAYYLANNFDRAFNDGGRVVLWNRSKKAGMVLEEKGPRGDRFWSVVSITPMDIPRGEAVGNARSQAFDEARLFGAPSGPALDGSSPSAPAALGNRTARVILNERGELVNAPVADERKPEIKVKKRRIVGDHPTPQRRIIGDSGRQYTPEQQAMFDNTGRAETKAFGDALKRWANRRWTQEIFDQFAPVKDLSQQAYVLARLSKGSAGATEALLHHGKLSLRDGVYDADMSGGLLETVFYPLGKETTDFLYWIAGNRAERLAREGRENLFSPQDILAAKTLASGTTDFDYTLANGTVTRDRAAIYQDSLVKFNGFQSNVLDMAEQSGLIDGASRHLWEHDFYVPFYRVVEDEVRGGDISKGVVRQKAFEKLKGGKDKLNDLLGNTLMNMAHLIDASAKNRAAKEIIETAVLLNAAHPAQPGEKGAVWYMDGGQKQSYVVDDEGIMVAVEGLDYAGLRGPLWDILTKPKHWLTVGVTASPYFKIRNLIRDSVQSVAVSGLGYNVAGNLAQGGKDAKAGQAMMNFLKGTANLATLGVAKDTRLLRQKNDVTQEYVSALAGGGLIRFGTMLEGNEAARTRQLIKKGASDAHILDSEGKLRRFYDAVLEPALAAYNELGNRGEEINRMALYHQMIDQGVDHATASLMARDLMDFSLQGSSTTARILSQVVPFLNARAQGMYKLGRAGKAQPGKMAAVVGAAAIISLALLAAYKDDEDWKKREEWDRDNYWWFKAGGKAYRIPKPFEVGAVATLAERSAELMFDDEMTGKRFREVVTSLLASQLAMNPVPQAFKPILDIYANEDSFTKRPIESMAMERLEPQERYRGDTSMVARGASKAMMGALSPVQIDHLVRGYFSWLGSFVLGGTDRGIRMLVDEPTRPAQDPFKFATGGMVAELDSAGSRYVTQMYKQAQLLEEYYNTYRDKLKKGEVAEAKAYREEHAAEIDRYRRVESVKGAVQQLNKRIREIERGDMTPAEKRLRINAIRKQQDEKARSLSR